MEFIEILMVIGLTISIVLNIVLYTKYKNLEVNKERRKLLMYRTSVVFPEKDLPIENENKGE